MINDIITGLSIGMGIYFIKTIFDTIIYITSIFIKYEIEWTTMHNDNSLKAKMKQFIRKLYK